MDEWQIALVLFAHPSREKKILKRCHHCLFFLPCFIEEKKKKIEKGKKCRRDSNSISFKIDQKKDIKARKAGTSLLLSPSAFVVSWLGLHLVAVIIQQLAAVVYPGPLGLAVHDLDDAPAVEDMAAITQVVSWKLRRQNIYVIYRTNRGGRGGGGGGGGKMKNMEKLTSPQTPSSVASAPPPCTRSRSAPGTAGTYCGPRP